MKQGFLTTEQKQIRDIRRLIRETRKEKKISQETLADAIGISRVTYTERENNINKMRLEEFLITINELGIGFSLYEKGET